MSIKVSGRPSLTVENAGFKSKEEQAKHGSSGIKDESAALKNESMALKDESVALQA
jgi:hypothetical protein